MAEEITKPGDEPTDPAREPYEPPLIELLGSIGALTRGPDPGTGDVPSGVISF
ncbi:MAG: hypothetical protein QOH36_308 [Actinomycetota bacterium]|nr:hypothetical protein [Actinomycetota bacterium]MEA2972520.1 hypothetical protein [Actinomycetota bacterium]